MIKNLSLHEIRFNFKEYMVKKLYILRHGQTDYNKNGMVQGSGIDAPLNETGYKQADAFYQEYQDIPFDKVYTSNLIRTEQTIEKFITKGIPYEKLDNLREISWGKQEGVAFTPETSTHYQQTCERWRQGDYEAKIDGGENPLEVVKRQKEAMEIILGRTDEKNVLICMHGRAMRMMISWMLNYPLSKMDLFHHSNGGFYLVNYTGKQFSVELFNETAHLEGI